MSLTYNPDIFEAADLEAAREIILTSENGAATDERWERETPYLTELLGEALGLQPGQIVVDYGCGVGRIAKALIERYGCVVLGVDSSLSMRAMASGYVGSAAFSIVSRQVFDTLIRRGFAADVAISVWVLQHCIQPGEDITLIRRGLKPGGALAVVNNLGRAVPAVEQRWGNDDIDVRALLASRFGNSTTGQLAAEAVGEHMTARTFWGVYR